ncbi:Methylosome protein 50 [Vulpes lagopus]
MGRSGLGPPALVAAAGLAPSGSSRTLVPPPTRASAPLSRQRPEWLTSLGLGTGILVASDSGELDKNQTLIVSEFCKYEYDDIVSTVSVLSSGTQAHSGQVICVTASPHKDSMFLSCGEAALPLATFLPPWLGILSR